MTTSADTPCDPTGDGGQTFLICLRNVGGAERGEPEWLPTGEFVRKPPSRGRAERLRSAGVRRAQQAAYERTLGADSRRQKRERWVAEAKASLPRRVPPGLQRPGQPTVIPGIRSVHAAEQLELA